MERDRGNTQRGGDKDKEERRRGRNRGEKTERRDIGGDAKGRWRERES
jgi:hypothetical protein